MIDINGQKPGDRFLSVDDAVKDFLMIYMGKSINGNNEYGCDIEIIVVYKYTARYFGTSHGLEVYHEISKVTYYTYEAVQKGHNKSCPIPDNPDRVARVHTHAAYDANLEIPPDGNDVFSITDINNANFLKVPYYLGTPIGSARKYDYIERFDQEIFIGEDLPYERNHPQRWNNLNYKNLKKIGGAESYFR